MSRYCGRMVFNLSVPYVCKLFTTQAQMHYSELPNKQYNRSETWTG